MITGTGVSRGCSTLYNLFFKPLSRSGYVLTSNSMSYTQSFYDSDGDHFGTDANGCVDSCEIRCLVDRN